jgi:hypothetical protein
MKTKFKITIEADVDYPGVKNTKRMEKAFNDWLIEFSTDKDLASPIPVLYDDTNHDEITVSHHADAKIKVTIEKEEKIFFQKEWDAIGNPYGD